MPNALIVHSTEGTTIAGAAATMRANRSMSHEVYDPRIDEYLVLIGWADPARSLRNMRGGVETNNRPGVWQLEVVGKATEIPNYPDRWHQNLAKRIRFICELLDIPIVAPKPFVSYPDSYGLRNGIRLTDAEWNAAEGIYGHQHVPENTHGDPGDISRTLAYLIGETPMADNALETEIKHWQQWINDLGYEPPLEIDGDRGPITDGARDTIAARWKTFETELDTRTKALDAARAQLAALEKQLDDAVSEPPPADRLTLLKADRYDRLAAIWNEGIAGIEVA